MFRIDLFFVIGDFMTELKSDEVKKAVSSILLEIVPDCSIYTESVTSPKYPHIFVHELKSEDDEDRKSRHFITYSFDLRYRAASDPSTEPKLERKLEEMSLRLFSGLNLIPFGSGMVRVNKKRAEKTDGVLHFFCEIKIQALLVNLSDKTTKQNKIAVEIRGKNG